MVTYQDLLLIGDDEEKRKAFVKRTIYTHKNSDEYETALLAEEYYRRRNRTIVQFQKMLYTLSGGKVPDIYSANYKLTSNFFGRFVTQQNQYLLGNGVSWSNEQTEQRLGADFDNRLQEAGKYALIDGVSFGFFNYDHIEVFELTEFVPLWDEENGSLSAGIRFWQIDDSKPLRATLYEIDGYTDYIWGRRDANGNKDNKGEILHEKRPYVVKVRESEVDGTEIIDGENYPTFPIVPLWGNPNHQSELVGLQEQIDAYDLIKSGYCNTVDEASIIYWTITNAGGMDDVDLAQFIERIKTIHAVTADTDQTITPNTIEAPYQSREALLASLSKDLYRDYMALDVDNIASGAATATQIKAAYEPLETKANEYEYCVLDFLYGILAVAGIEDEPSFTRTRIINASEEVQTVLTAAQFLDADYVTEKVLNLLGDGDKLQEVLDRMTAEDSTRMQEDILVEEEPIVTE